MNIEQLTLAIVIILYTYIIPGDSLRCYECFINPKPNHTYTDTPLCTRFDASDQYIVDCPDSTMCMKQEFYLDIQDNVRIKGVLRGCATQKYEYQELIRRKWYPKVKIMEPYEEGCKNIDIKEAKITVSSHCYCRGELCNSSPSTSNHEGYTDIMCVIVVFNLMKYINSLR